MQEQVQRGKEMTPDNVLECIEKISGIKFTRATLTKYENIGLVRRPRRGGSGRGGGRWTDYAETAVAEALTAYLLINGKYHDFASEIPPRLSPDCVLSGKIEAIISYKHRHEKRDRFDLSQAEEMEVLFDLLNDEILHQSLDIYNKKKTLVNLEMKASWVKFISWVATVWEYEYRKAWKMYCQLYK